MKNGDQRRYSSTAQHPPDAPKRPLSCTQSNPQDIGTRFKKVDSYHENTGKPQTHEEHMPLKPGFYFAVSASEFIGGYGNKGKDYHARKI
ncbi:MAG: hypothetical protein HOK97_01805 [Deltaproteobacteria bacterium]|nr:hypothetical protein [Deltaproteobacteria bacterium]MBT6488471.1 hypothetical protein [Deltaproteobacteria bacterium]